MFVNADCRVSFFVRASTSALNEEPFVFDHVLVNDGSAFEQDPLNVFLAPFNGIYWLTYTIVAQGPKADFSIVGFNELPNNGIYKLHDTFPEADSISRDSMRSLATTQELYFSNNDTTYADATLWSSWGGFIISYLFQPTVAFDVVSSISCFSNDITFDTVLINEGGAWSTSDSTFVVPIAGMYYFSVSFGFTQYSWGFFAVQRANTADFECCELNYIDSGGSGPHSDLISRGTFLSLQVADVVRIRNNLVPAFSDIISGPLSFRGFFYSPYHGQQVAWSLHVDDRLSGTGTVQFSVIYINVPSVWNGATSSINIPLSGTYYTEFLAEIDSDAGAKMDLRLMRNKNITLAQTVYGRLSTFITRGRSVVVQLNVNDALTVTYVNSNIGGGTKQGLSSLGFLLYPR